MSEQTADNNPPSEQTDKEIAALKDKIVWDATERVVKYIQLRFLWVPGLLLVIAGYFGISAWVKDISRQEIRETIADEVGAGKLRIDSLVTQADGSVERLKRAEYYSGQIQILMKQYEFVIASAAQKSPAKDTIDISTIMKSRFTILETGKGYRLTVSRIGNPERISAFVAREDSVIVIFEIPVALISSKLESLKSANIMIEVPPGDAPPTFVARAPMTFKNIDDAAAVMDRLFAALLGPGDAIVEYYSWRREDRDTSTSNEDSKKQ